MQRVRDQAELRTQGRERRGFTILELLVSVSIIGLLIALLLPAISAARESAREMQCRTNLKQIGLALHGYHELHGCLPAAWQLDESEESGYAWAVPLLPLLERQHQFAQIDRTQAISTTADVPAARESISLMLCPSDIIEPSFALFDEHAIPTTTPPLVELPTASYVGVYGTFEADEYVPPPLGDGVFIGTRPVRFTELERGLSNVLVVGERTMARVPSTWLGIDFRGEDAACRIVGNAEFGPNHANSDECEFNSRHAEHANFLWGDGHVRPISATVDSEAYRAMAQRAVTQD